MGRVSTLKLSDHPSAESQFFRTTHPQYRKICGRISAICYNVWVSDNATHPQNCINLWTTHPNNRNFFLTTHPQNFFRGVVTPLITFNGIAVSRIWSALLLPLTRFLFWNVLLRIAILSLSDGSEMHSSKNLSCSVPFSLFKPSQNLQANRTNYLY